MSRRLASDSFENDTHSTERAKNNTPPFSITTDELSNPTEPHQPATAMQAYKLELVADKALTEDSVERKIPRV